MAIVGFDPYDNQRTLTKPGELVSPLGQIYFCVNWWTLAKRFIADILDQVSLAISWLNKECNHWLSNYSNKFKGCDDTKQMTENSIWHVVFGLAINVTKLSPTILQHQEKLAYAST